MNQLAKIAPKIPIDGDAHLSPSTVHCAWALKQFWEGATSGGRKAQRGEPPTQAGWIHRYESCHESLNKLDPQDFSLFVQGVLFSKTSLEKVYARRHHLNVFIMAFDDVIHFECS